ncbi:MAG TPA: hypothetical protein VFN15_07455, partial [Solirubrobacterales bacterium]|nr:hypothetical protein [Solirubrobacterales bacterium]
MGAVQELDRAREAYEGGAWERAHDLLARADEEARLAPDDLELLATAAYMLGRDDEHMRLLERAHRDHLGAGDELAAIRCAAWLSIFLTV